MPSARMQEVNRERQCGGVEGAAGVTAQGELCSVVGSRRSAAQRVRSRHAMPMVLRIESDIRRATAESAAARAHGVEAAVDRVSYG